MYPHGIDDYYVEIRRFERRLSGMTVAVGVALLAGLWSSRLPVVARMLRTIPIVRFGFEGPEQYVRRIELKAESGQAQKHTGIQPIYVPPSRRGGARALRITHHPNVSPDTRLRFPGEGESDIDRLARARAAAANVPLVQSQDLIIEELVRPVYPEEARDHGIEGRVAVLALVDTLGQVADVEVVGASEKGLLEQAATEAVWKCRFRPYRVDGEIRPVYAMFRFAFRMY